MKNTVFDRTITALQKSTVKNVRKAWEEIADTARALTSTIRPELPNQDKDRLLTLMEESLQHKGGEVSARRRTIELGQMYLSLNEKGKLKFLRLLASQFCIDRNALKDTFALYQEASNRADQLKIETTLRQTLEPKRIKILRQFSSLPQGVKFLVDLRSDLLKHRKDSAELNAMEMDLRSLLASWFDVGLLNMQDISWDSPAALLEKLIAYEAVHAIQSWDDLKNRLDSDRKCFAFFHHKMPKEPLIFVQVALTTSIADDIHTLLDETAPSIDPKEANTAIFYSISNAQRGLAGISFGNFLIKRVVERITQELPNIKQFATLSPIPQFRRWLSEQSEDDLDAILSVQDKRNLMALHPESSHVKDLLEHVLDSPWHKNAILCAGLKKPLMRLCAHYLLKERRKGKAWDPVANFHLSNGARMERLNWLADTSEKGLEQSAGMMVNYQYHLAKIEDYHESYSSGKTIPASTPMRTILK